jgi:membrane protease YdiL (CAAX protease family)
MTTAALDSYALVILAFLAVVEPLQGIWEYSRLRRRLAEGRADGRLRTYRTIMVMQWALVAGLLGWWLVLGRGLEAAGFAVPAAGLEWVAVAAGLVATALLVVQMRGVLGSEEKLAEVRGRFGRLHAIVPRGRTEANAFAARPATAGVCEEILYRGLLLGALAPALGLWPAVALTSLVFGLGHAYQGVSGILKATAVGLVMALLVVFSGSLWTAIVLHAAIDLTSGRMAGAAVEAAPASA